MKTVVRVNVNGQNHELLVTSNATLLEVLREELGLIGTKHGCELGECGACTVLVDGVPMLSCLTMPINVQGTEILTVEGLGTVSQPHPLQTAFSEAGAVQCGFCTPGMILSSKALLDNNPKPSREEIKDGLSGNICRCTGYNMIFDAVELASQRISGQPRSEHGCSCLKQKA